MPSVKKKSTVRHSAARWEQVAVSYNFVLNSLESSEFGGAPGAVRILGLSHRLLLRSSFKYSMRPALNWLLLGHTGSANSQCRRPFTQSG